MMNVLRLVRYGGTAVIYNTRSHDFREVRTPEDWQAVIGQCASGLRDVIEKEDSAERIVCAHAAQASLWPSAG